MTAATDAIREICKALPPTRTAVVNPVKQNVIEVGNMLANARGRGQIR